MVMTKAVPPRVGVFWLLRGGKSNAGQLPARFPPGRKGATLREGKGQYVACAVVGIKVLCPTILWACRGRHCRGTAIYRQGRRCLVLPRPESFRPTLSSQHRLAWHGRRNALQSGQRGIANVAVPGPGAGSQCGHHCQPRRTEQQFNAPSLGRTESSQELFRKE